MQLSGIGILTGRAIVAAVILALLAAACTAEVPAVGPGPVPPVTVEIDPAAGAELDIAGLSTAPLHLSVEAGDLGGPATVSTSPASGAGPAPVAWFTPQGQVTDVIVDGRIDRTLTLSYPAGNADQIPVIWREDPDLGWYPIAVGAPGAPAVAERSEFSPHVPGLAEVGSWLDAAAGTASDWFRQRGDEPVCTAPAPDWAELTAPTLDVLHTCIGDDPGSGEDRVEIQLVNNRGLTQRIAIPDAVAYADVQDQPEYVRSLVRTIAGGDDVVLLPPGKRLSIGFTRPADDRQVTLVPRPNRITLAFDAALVLADSPWAEGSDLLLVALLQIQACSGQNGDLLQGVLPTSVGAITDFLIQWTSCGIGAAADLPTAVALAEKIVAAKNGVPLSIVESDRAFGKQVQVWAGRLNLLGTLAKSAELARKAVVIWENNAELLGREFAVADPAAVRLDLTAEPAPATDLIQLAAATRDGVPAGGWTVQDETGVVDCGYPSPASVSDGIQYCSPTASSADACWPERGGAAVLCMWDPWEPVLHRMVATGVVPDVPTEGEAEPIGIELADGTRCRLRNGGSWSSQETDDSLAGFYYCLDVEEIVWAEQGGSAFDTSSPRWTVRLGRDVGPLRTVGVVRAYVVAMAG